MPGLENGIAEYLRFTTAKNMFYDIYLVSLVKDYLLNGQMGPNSTDF